MDEIIARLSRLGCDEDDIKTIAEKLTKGGYNKLAKLTRKSNELVRLVKVSLC